jgi:phage repressor protein C with HTH and peptisase S24 domain
MELPIKIVGKHRAFTLKGDSMPPLKDGSLVVGRHIDSLADIKDGETYIVQTKNDGIVYKRIYRERNKQPNLFEFHSDNPLYPPYIVQSENIEEIWSFVCNLNIAEFDSHELKLDNVIRFLQSYHVEMVR